MCSCFTYVFLKQAINSFPIRFIKSILYPWTVSKMLVLQLVMDSQIPAPPFLTHCHLAPDGEEISNVVCILSWVLSSSSLHMEITVFVLPRSMPSSSSLDARFSQGPYCLREDMVDAQAGF